MVTKVTVLLNFFSIFIENETMTRNKKLNLISVLLALTAIAMIVVGVVMKIPAPAITGVGFLLIVWAFQVLK